MEVKLNFGTKFIQFGIYCKKKKSNLPPENPPPKMPLNHKTKEPERRKKTQNNGKYMKIK